jgi:hypothetical protein
VVGLATAAGEEKVVEAAFHLMSPERFVLALREVTEERLTQRRLLTLWQLSSLVAASLDAELVLRNLVEQLAEFLAISHLHVVLVDGERAEVMPVVAYREGAPAQVCLRERKAGRKLAELPLVARVVTDLEAISVRPADPEDWKRLVPSDLPEELPAWAALVPMIVRGRASGIFVLADRAAERTLSALEL